jgi:hypothetical protein
VRDRVVQAAAKLVCYADDFVVLARFISPLLRDRERGVLRGLINPRQSHTPLPELIGREVASERAKQSLHPTPARPLGGGWYRRPRRPIPGGRLSPSAVGELHVLAIVPSTSMNASFKKPPGCAFQSARWDRFKHSCSTRISACLNRRAKSHAVAGSDSRCASNPSREFSSSGSCSSEFFGASCRWILSFGFWGILG